MFGSKLDRRSEAQKRDDMRFMEALGRIPTLRARNGHISMEASDLESEVEKLGEIAKKMVSGHH